MMKAVLSSVLCVKDSGAYAESGLLPASPPAPPASAPASAAACGFTDSSSTLPDASSTFSENGVGVSCTLTVPCGCFHVTTPSPASTEGELAPPPLGLEQCAPSSISAPAPSEAGCGRKRRTGMGY